MALGVLDELLIGLGFDYDPKDLEKYRKDAKAAADVVKTVAAAAVAGTAAMLGFAAASTASSDAQGKLSNKSGVAVEEIGALSHALRIAGGDSNAMGGNLEQLAIRASEAARGVGSGVEAFGILGVSISDINGELKSTDQLFLEIADSMQGLSKSEQIELSDKLGLRDSVLLLQEGAAGIEKLTRRAKLLGVTTAEDARAAALFQDSLSDITLIGTQFSRVLTRAMLPMLQKLTDGFTDWWIANRKIIEQRIPKYIDYAAKAIKLLTIAAGAFVAVKLGGVLASLFGLLKGVAAGALLSNLAIAALPITIGAIIASIALLAEDANAFFNGQKSLIGDLIERYPEWANEIQIIAAQLMTIADLTKRIFSGWGAIFDYFENGDPIGDFIIAWNYGLSELEAKFEETKENIKQFFSDLWSDIVIGFADNVIAPVMDKVKGIKDLFSFDGLSNFFSSEDRTTAAGLSEQAGATINNSISQSTVRGGSVSSRIELGGVSVSVGDSSDPNVGRQIGESIREALEPILIQASQDLNSAVEQ